VNVALLGERRSTFEVASPKGQFRSPQAGPHFLHCTPFCQTRTKSTLLSLR